MGEPTDGASSGPIGDMDPPTRGLDAPVGLAGGPALEEPNAKVTRKMFEQHVPSSEEEEEEKNEEEEEDEDEGEEENDNRGKEKERTRGRVLNLNDIFKYGGCSWPGVVGLKVHKAKRIIRKGKPDIYFEVVPKNQMMTMCYLSRRVRLIVDRSNCVVQTPRVG